MSLRSWLMGRFGRSKGGDAIEPSDLSTEGRLPEFKGITAWLNTEPLTTEDLRGKVVLIDFWTYSCINCIRTLPHVAAWHERYKDKGLVIVGIHSPEFDFEHDLSNVKTEAAKHGIAYPVALDNDYTMWRAYGNKYWPAHYFVDTQGRIRAHHFGEGDYARSEAIIRALLKEAGNDLGDDKGAALVPTTDFSGIGTPETYLGYDRMEHLGSPEALRMDEDQRYTVPAEPAKNIFYFDGTWEIRKDCAIPKGYGARIIYRVRAAKVNLVMDGKTTHARIQTLVDGKEVGGPMDVTEGRLYSLVDGTDSKDMLVEVRFLEPDVKVFAFTFG